MNSASAMVALRMQPEGSFLRVNDPKEGEPSFYQLTDGEVRVAGLVG